MNKFYAYFLFLLLLPCLVIGQKKSVYRPANAAALGPCTFPGTTPGTAIPVCGTSVFTQENVFDCDIPDINPTECPGSNFPASKSFWYKFKCFTAGNLGFTISPKGEGDDYDWILFDVTGHNPDDVFTDKTMVLSLNGTAQVIASPPVFTKTGASATGISNVNCYDGNPPTDQFNQLIDLQVGHNYLLMVTSFPNDGSTFLGYNLSFGGGTAGITDGDPPLVDHLDVGCSNIKVFFTTDIKCSSVTTLGSEYAITPSTGATITGITSVCPSGFIAIKDMTINLSQQLPPGNYNLVINKGTDADTYLNICDNPLAEGTSIPFTVLQPKSSFTYPPEGCTNPAINFTSTSDPLSGNTITEWHWNFGDASTGVGAAPTHTYTTSGTYTVKHWIVNSKGCNSDTTSHDIYINVQPTPDFSNSGPYCIGKDVTFTDLSVPNAGTLTNWHWDMGDGNIFDLPNANPFTHQYTASGVKTVTLTVTTSKGCIQTINKQVTINPLPTATAAITGNNTACLNGPSPGIVFTGSGGTAPYIFDYSINGIAQPPVVSNLSGTYTFSVPTSVAGSFIYAITNVQEGSGNHCGQGLTNVSATINVAAPPTASISGSIEVCAGDGPHTITFNGTGGTPPYKFTYHVTRNGITDPDQTVTGNPATLTLPNTGMWAPIGPGGTIPQTYTYVYSLVNVEESSGLQCAQPQTGDATIIINQKPWTNVIVIPPYCGSTTVKFLDALTFPQQTINLISWTWDFGDPASGPLNTSTLQNPEHIYSAPGIYTIRHTSTSDKGCTDGGIIGTITVNERPHADFIPPEVCLNDSYAQFNDNSTITAGNITNWKWDFGDPGSGPLNTSTSPNPQHSYSAVGPYDVKLIVTSNNGCSDTLTRQIFVNGSFPLADINLVNTGNICADDIITIANQSTVFPGTITKVEIFWDDVGAPGVFELDNVPTPGKNYTHLYPSFQSPATKDYTIRFRAYSGGVCMNDKLLIVKLNAKPKIVFNNIPDTCLLAAPFQLTQATEPNAIPGNGVYSGTGIINPNGTFDPAVAGIGTHTITYTYTSLAGCTDVATKTIKVLDTASAKFIYSAPPACDGTPVTFTDRSVFPAGVVLANTVWDFGDLSPAENHAPGSSFTHTFPAAGTYTVKMYNTSAYGCNSTFTSQQVLVSPIPATLFEFGETSVCIPIAKVSFINKSTIADGSENAFTYYWDLGDPASGPLNSYTSKTPPPHIYSGVGPYTVSLTVTSGARCPKTYTDVVDFIHPQPKATFVTDKPSVCLDESVKLTDVTDPLDGTTSSWHWDMGDGDKPGTPVVEHTYLQAGTFTMSFYIINSHNCNSDTAFKSFTVYPYPVVNAGPDRRVLEGSFVKMQPQVSGDDLQYLWTPSLYLTNNRILAPMAQYIKDDITYKLTVTGRGGCPKSDDVLIKVLKNLKIPNTFTPNNDGINDKWAIQYLDDYANCRVQVFTRTGQKVFESQGIYKAWDGTFNGKPLPFDTYYYIIEAGDGRDPVTGYVTIVK
jgi:gliding motility-associated-like protein